MKGRKPKPTALRLIEGNREHRTINAKEPKPKSSAPPCPEVLGPIARKHWDYLISELEQMGTLAHSDQGIITAAVAAYSRWYRAEEQLRKEEERTGEYAETEITKAGNNIQNPLVGIANAALAAMAKYESELGLSPTARTRIKVEKDAPQSRRERLLT